MKIKVSVPATSANVGSGFDALGLAVTLYNTVTFEESDRLDISAADGTRIPRNESNLVYRSAKGLFDKVGKKTPPLKIVQTNPIPMARGLGSSSACIIAGLLGANRMLGDVLNTQELLTLATAIEGHPDNVAPALLGGLTSSVFEDGVVYSVKRDVDQSPPARPCPSRWPTRMPCITFPGPRWCLPPSVRAGMTCWALPPRISSTSPTGCP